MNEKKTDNFLHLVLVLGLILLSQSYLYSQSKKKQIEILNFKIDSVNKKLANDRKMHQDEINTLINKNKEQDIKRLSNQNILNQLTLENKKSNSQLDDLKSESESIIKEIENLRDSLIRLTEEEIKKQTNFKSVEIGNQTWMVENLNVSTFRNGDPIPEAKTNEEWEKAGKESKPAWCYYDNDPKNDAKYGKLYNWYAVSDPRGLAPAGWHVPSQDEWEILIKNLQGTASEKMKTKDGWNGYGCVRCFGGGDVIKANCSACKGTQNNITEPRSGNGINSFGFSAKPAGERRLIAHYNSFHSLGKEANWWSSDEQNIDVNQRDLYLNQNPAKFTNIVNNYPNSPLLFYKSKGDGLSVRCLKD